MDASIFQVARGHLLEHHVDGLAAVDHYSGVGPEGIARHVPFGDEVGEIEFVAYSVARDGLDLGLAICLRQNHRNHKLVGEVDIGMRACP